MSYQNVEKQKCKNMCNSFNRQKCAIETAFKCEKCDILCNNEKCYNIHTEKLCNFVRNCEKCGLFKNRKHVCEYNNKWYKIEYNKGLRSVMKVLLNSFWGRFGMNTNKTQSRLISKPDEWFEMISDDQYIIHDVDLSHSNFIQVFYSIADELHDGGIHTSVTLAAFVTCHARLKLYHELKKIGDRVLYFDTDSIIYINRAGEYDPPLVDYLGEFTDEVKKKGANYIEEFISAGPKNYAYKLDNGKTYCTVKGFTLNHLSSL
ncbi:unnamed protein product [Brachionus calyciflorus]|uniref:DNA-directed DNA polymerase n=1 Tax=Brachionus calyciflorus TaxID=104777 RepID=A0A814DUN4_9BILA|nr:unnamed protein product [Brachionus calyciflorus]